jgi:flagellar motor switch protein FliM
MDGETVPFFTLGPGHLRRLRNLHERLAGDFAAALCDLLRAPVDVHLTGVDQLGYGQFLAALPTPSCFSLLRADPLEDRLMLDIEPAILYPMIDRLLGGRGDEPPPARPLSDIELPLALRVVRLFLEHLRRAWKSTWDLKFEVLQVERNPRLLRVLPADEPVVLVGFQLTVGDLQGMLRLCLPCRAIQRLGERQTEMPAEREVGSLVELAVTLATTPIAQSDLEGLRLGDIIATETAVGTPAVVSIAGEPKFRGQPGVCQGHNAVRLTESIEGGS